jgi:tetratricopeptide (TPR) repeat protein
VDVAQNLNYQKRLPTIFVILGSYSLLIDEDFSKAIQSLERALDISKETKDYFSMWSAYWFTALGLYYENESEKCIEYLKKGIDLSEAINNPGPAIFLKSYMVTWFYNWQGKIELANKISLECVRVAEEIGDIYYKTPAYISYGALNYVKGDFVKAESYLLQALSFSEKTGHYTNWMTACQIICELFWSQSKFEELVYYYEKTISVLEPTKYRLSEIGLYRVCMLAARVKSQDRPFQLDEMMNYYSKIRSMAMKHRCGRYICETLANDDLYLDEAENWIEKIIAADQKWGFHFFLGRDYAIYADILHSKGDITRARNYLTKAIKMFKQCGADGWVAKIENQQAS